MDFKYITQDERERLYEEVWKERLPDVAKKYNISDTTLRKHMKRLRIPLPPRGYWTKANNGEVVKKDKLPGVTGGLKKHVKNYAIKYRTDIDDLSDIELSSNEELHLLREETIVLIKDKCSNVTVGKQLRNPHPLITDHKEEIKVRSKRSRELKMSYNKVLTPKEFDGNVPILPILVSTSNINRVYRILDTIINMLDEIEGYTRVEIKQGKDTAYFSIMYTIFYFEIKEKDNSLILSMVAEDWISYNSTKKEAFEFRDLKDAPLEDQVGNLVYKMFVVANRLYAEYKLEERIQERKWEIRDRERKLEQMRKGELGEIKQLLQVSSDWNKAIIIRSFADDMELKIHSIDDKDKKEKLLIWLQWARDKADWMDPLVEKEDELLGKSISLFEQILEE